MTYDPPPNLRFPGPELAQAQEIRDVFLPEVKCKASWNTSAASVSTLLVPNPNSDTNRDSILFLSCVGGC